MQKIDYGDVNKFLVSAGFFLIGFSVVIPYVYLRESFGIYIEEEKIESYNESTKILIEEKQNLIGFVQDFIPSISLTLLLIGLAAIIVGLIRWFQRQNMLDDRFLKETDKVVTETNKLKKETANLTKEEKAASVKAEADEIKRDEEKEAKILETPRRQEVKTINIYRLYQEIEERVLEKFKNFKSKNFDYLPQVRLGENYKIDLILKSNTKKFSDRLIEIKYFNNSIPFTTIIKTLDSISTHTSYYKENLNSRVVPVLIIVYNPKNIVADQILELQDKVFNHYENIPNLKRLKIEFIKEDSIDSFNIRRILKK